MKKILKNNQIIITALAIMIAIAGYLNYVQKVGSENDYQSVLSGDVDNLNLGSLDISEEDIFAENQAASASSGKELIDIDSLDSDVDEAKSDIPGEAVLTGGTTITSIIAVKLKREQSKSLQRASLMEVINSDGVTETQKQAAISMLLEINNIAQKEAESELLLEAKGYTDVVVSITDGTADVVVNAAFLSDADRAKIEDIVKRKTGVSPEKIIIVPFVDNN